MTVAPRLSVRLSTTKRDMHVTRQVGDLQFRITAPGGFASASIVLARPLNLTPDELAYYGRLYVYDARNGTTVWEGRVEDLGRATGAGGSEWSINAVGPMAHAQDTNTALIYQDVATGSWTPAQGAPGWLQTGQINTVTNGPGIQLLIPRDTVVSVGNYPAWEYRVLGDNNLNLAVLAVRYGEDTTDANFAWQFQVLPIGALTVALTHTFVGGSNTAVAAVISTDFAVGEQYIRLNLVRNTSTTTVASDAMAASFVQMIVRSTLFSQAGVEFTNGATYSGVPLTASTVVADLLGRLLPLFDGANAAISTAQDYTFTEQLAYPGGTTAAQVLGDLMTLLPGMYWTAGATNPATGKWSFAWQPWPTTVRYDVTARDGFSSPGSAAGIYDAVTVRYLDAAGTEKTVTRTAANPILTAAGFHRTTRLDLGSPLGGSNAAAQAGDQFLAQNAVPPAAGTVSVSRPIFDRVLGHSVQPWEIQPGYLLRIRNVAPASSTDGNRDGVSTFRVVALTYTQADNTAVLELDSPSVSWVNQFAALQADQQYQLRP